MNLQRRYTQFKPPVFQTTKQDKEKIPSALLTGHPVHNKANKLKRKGLTAVADEPTPVTRSQVLSKDLAVVSQESSPHAVTSEVVSISAIRVQYKSPWGSLTRRFSLVLEDKVSVASKKDGLFVAVKAYSYSEINQEVETLQRIQREQVPNFLELLDCFSFQGAYHMVFEHEVTRGDKLSMTLGHYALIKQYPAEMHLAIILKQIINGLKHLAFKGLEHRALKCRNILISTEGRIRIAANENCCQIGSKFGSSHNIRSVGYVTMELMHKDAAYEGPIKVRDTSRWPLDSEAVRFLLMTESAYSFEELEKHPLLQADNQESDMNDIRAQIYTAEFSVFRGHDVPC